VESEINFNLLAIFRFTLYYYYLLSQRKAFMPEMILDISVKEVAKMLKVMNDREMETLTLLLTKEGTELLELKKDLELNRVEFIPRDETFDV
jgi:hypothetical protein